jgi:hypothetical protein
VWAPVYPQALRVGDAFQISMPMDNGTRIFRLNSKPQLPLTIVADTSAVRVRWSAAVGGQKLQTKASLTGSWVDVQTPSRPVGDYYEAVTATTNSSAFFRLMRTF